MFKKGEFKGLTLKGLNGAFDTINLEFVFSTHFYTKQREKKLFIF